MKGREKENKHTKIFKTRMYLQLFLKDFPSFVFHRGLGESIINDVFPIFKKP